MQGHIVTTSSSGASDIYGRQYVMDTTTAAAGHHRYDVDDNDSAASDGRLSLRLDRGATIIEPEIVVSGITAALRNSLVRAVRSALPREHCLRFCP